MSEVVRAGVYIDGFNLYFGISDQGWEDCKWLNLQAVAARVISPGARLEVVRYFTARISGPEDKARRQSVYLDALTAYTGIVPIEGRYRSERVQCKRCGLWRWENEEKMTDVAIATEVLADCYSGRVDEVVIVSGDADLVPPVLRVQKDFPRVTLKVVFPPGRRLDQLADAAPESSRLKRKALLECQLPNEIVTDSYTYRRPPNWEQPVFR